MSFLTTKGKAPVTAQAQQRLSEKAAAFGQHIVDLEEALTAAQGEIATLDRRAKLAEGEREQLRESLKLAVRDKDYYQKVWLETRAKLKSAASIILDAMREDEDNPIDTYRPSPSSVRAVAKALGTRFPEQDEKALPDFLAAGPREEQGEK